MTRLSDSFARLKSDGKAGFVAYVMAGDPDAATTLEVMHGLVEAGADVIELGAPFTDPMADGLPIQRAALRALASGMSLRGVITLIAEFRKTNAATPVVIMGYANPFHAMGYQAFVDAAAAAGADGVICVDLPPEEDAPLREPMERAGLSLIRLATPPTDDARLPQVVKNTSGFVYYVSTTGVTGAGIGQTAVVSSAVDRVRQASGLPVAVGFGVKTPERAAEIAKVADAVVVGSAIVDALADHGVNGAVKLAKELASATHNAR